MAIISCKNVCKNQQVNCHVQTDVLTLIVEKLRLKKTDSKNWNNEIIKIVNYFLYIMTFF